MDGVNKAEEIVKFASALQRRKDQYKEFNKILRTALEYEDSPFKIFLHVEIDRPIDNNETMITFFKIKFLLFQKSKKFPINPSSILL